MMRIFFRHPWRTLAAVAVMLLTIWAWRHWTAPAPASALITAGVERGDIADTVLATGTIQAAQLINVGAQVSGQIQKIHVQIGDQVRQGQLIAEIDATTQHNSLRAARQQLAAMQAQLTSRQSALRLAQRNVQRQQYLQQHQATSAVDAQNAAHALAVAQAELQSLRAQIAQQQVQVQTALANVGYTRITAPQAGTVVAVVAREGQTVTASQIAPTIVKLANLETMRIQAQISEADVPRVQPGMAATFTILGAPDHPRHATLHSVEPGPVNMNSYDGTSTDSSGTSAVYYNGILDVPNPDGVLRIQMTAQVSIVLQQVQDVLLIPAAALQASPRHAREKNQQGAGRASAAGPTTATTAQPAPPAAAASGPGQPEHTPPAGKPYTVRVASQGADGAQTVQERTVYIGLNNRVQAQVLSGLEEGEQVVIGDAAGSRASQVPRRARIL